MKQDRHFLCWQHNHHLIAIHVTPLNRHQTAVMRNQVLEVHHVYMHSNALCISKTEDDSTKYVG
jgi:hypothetical protein